MRRRSAWSINSHRVGGFAAFQTAGSSVRSQLWIAVSLPLTPPEFRGEVGFEAQHFRPRAGGAHCATAHPRSPPDIVADEQAGLQIDLVTPGQFDQLHRAARTPPGCNPQTGSKPGHTHVQRTCSRPVRASSGIRSPTAWPGPIPWATAWRLAGTQSHPGMNGGHLRWKVIAVQSHLGQRPLCAAGAGRSVVSAHAAIANKKTGASFYLNASVMRLRASPSELDENEHEELRLHRVDLEAQHAVSTSPVSRQSARNPSRNSPASTI